MSFVGTNMIRDFLTSDEAIQLARAGILPVREDFIDLQIRALQRVKAAMAKPKGRRRK
jgi:hypothetical protein